MFQSMDHQTVTAAMMTIVHLKVWSIYFHAQEHPFPFRRRTFTKVIKA